MFIVRHAKLNDLDAIVNCNISMAKESENLELERDIVIKGVRTALTDETKALYFVAESDKDVVGTLMVTYEWSDWRNGNIWWLQSVYVLPEWREKGVFSAMFKHVRNLAKSQNVKGLRLYMKHTNKVAQAVYEHVGMIQSHYVVFEKMPL